MLATPQPGRRNLTISSNADLTSTPSTGRRLDNTLSLPSHARDPELEAFEKAYIAEQIARHQGGRAHQLRLFGSAEWEASQIHDPERRGYFALLQKIPDAERTRYRQRSYELAMMPDVIQQTDRSIDTYISQAEFFARTRRLVHFLRAPCLFVDIDTYNVSEIAGLSAEARMDRVFARCEERRLPIPSVVLDSGRGLQVKWILDSPMPRRALPRWAAIERYLTRAFEDLGADLSARDASRVLRVAQTVNTKTGTVVHVIWPRPGTPVQACSVEQIARAILPYTREQVEEFRRRDEWRKSDDRARSHLDRMLDVGPRLSGFGPQLWHDRVEDIIKLAALRGWNTHGVPEGSRDKFLFLVACGWGWAVQPPQLWDELAAVARIYVPAWDEHQVRYRTSAVLERAARAGRDQSITFDGERVDPRYRFRTVTIMEWLGIEAAEEPHMTTLISREEKRRRRQLRHGEDEARRTARRRAAGEVPRSEYLAQAAARRDQARQLRGEGLTWRQIADRMGITMASVDWLLRRR